MLDKLFVFLELQFVVRANGGEKRSVYRPHVANLLTNPRNIVNFMAVSDHGFGCYKLQFCTVPNSEPTGNRRKWKGRGFQASQRYLSFWDACQFPLTDLGFRCAIPHLHPDLFRRSHGVEHAADDLRRARSTGFIDRFFLQELGMGEDDAELIVQLVKKVPKFSRLVHGSPLEQICN